MPMIGAAGASLVWIAPGLPETRFVESTDPLWSEPGPVVRRFVLPRRLPRGDKGRHPAGGLKQSRAVTMRSYWAWSRRRADREPRNPYYYS